MKLGDLSIVGGEPTPKLVKALAVLGAHLHPTFDASGYFVQGKSKVSCILSSLIVRDFLFRIGFRDAEVAPVFFFIAAANDGGLLHSLGIGHWEPKKGVEAFNGHMVVRLPKHGWLIDTTLYQAIRPQWSDCPGMIATTLTPDGELWGMPVIARFYAMQDEVEVAGKWCDQPKNRDWKTAPDARATRKRNRDAVTNRLIELFGNWKD